MSFVDYEILSREERQECLESLREKRHVVTRLDSLKVLSARTIAKNHHLYLDRAVNSLQILPNTLVQFILGMIKAARNSSGRLVPKDLELKFVLQLLNRNVTEFDPNEFNPYSRSSNAVYYKHVVDNCPNMTKVIRGHSQFSHKLEELPLDDIFKWKNIKYIGFPMNLIRDQHLEQLLECLPNLEGIEGSVSESFSSKGIKCLSKMKKLKHLLLNTVKEKLDGTLDTELFVQCAGLIPNLQRFQFSDSRSLGFLASFAKQFPQKRLTVIILRLTTEFETDWPANLAVEKLTIQGELGATCVAKICSIPCHIRELTFDSVPFCQVYTILNSIGPRVRELRFVEFDMQSPEPAEPAESVDLFPIIRACPNLEKFYFSPSVPLAPLVETNLPLANFKKWKTFNIDDPRDIYDDEADETFSQVDHLLELFLLGNENYDRTLHVKNTLQIEVVEKVLKENRHCLQDLEKLTVDLFKEGMLERALDMSQKIIWTSPHLKKIKFKLCPLDPKAVPREVKKHYNYFNELVDGIGVHLKFVCEIRMGRDDSSYEDLTEFEDSDDSSGDDDTSNDEWQNYDSENDYLYGSDEIESDDDDDDDDEFRLPFDGYLLGGLIGYGFQARNPPPYCIGMPYLKEWAEVCLRMFDLNVSKHNFHGCTEAEAKLKKVRVAHYQLGCVDIGPKPNDTNRGFISVIVV